MLKKLMIFSAIVFFGANVFAQTMDEAGEKYNEGNEKYSAKAYADAVVSFEEALNICNTVGAEADGLKGNVEKQLNNAYYKNALSLYKKKKFDNAIEQMQKSADLAETLGDKSKKSKSMSYISKIHTTKGQTLVKSGKVDEAISEFDIALGINPKAYKTYLGKALAYKEKGDIKLMLENVDKTIEYGEGKEKAAKYVAKAKKLASSTLFNAGSSELAKEHGVKAAEHFNASMKYAAGTADTYYYIAVAYNKAKQYAKAIESANKALELKEGDKSDIYFEIGQAEEGNGNNAAACSAYKKVTGGNFSETAKYQITTVLKCS